MKEPKASREIQFYIEKDGENEMIMKLSRGKFYWKGKEIKDVRGIYERFDEWLKTADQRRLGVGVAQLSLV